MPRVLNVGSLNIDHVYHVDHVARPGETLASVSYEVFAGGKGANQSAALARAGAQVYHSGRVGSEGRWLVRKLEDLGVDVRHIVVDDAPGGHAIIQVDTDGENAIVLYPGCNHDVTENQIESALAEFSAGDFLLLQNEISEIPYLIKEASQRDLRVCFNPAPVTPHIEQYPLHLVDLFFLNRTEANALAAVKDNSGASLEEGIARIQDRLPDADLVVTLGSDGAVFVPRNRAASPAKVGPVPVEPVVDSTGAGDTFIGFFLATLARDGTTLDALETAAAAAALSVTRPGAMDSIPTSDAAEKLRLSHAGRNR